MEFLHLVDCLVALKMELFVFRREDGAIRCRRYMVTEVTLLWVKVYHHPRKKMLDAVGLK
jgi:hypothetical protein